MELTPELMFDILSKYNKDSKINKISSVDVEPCVGENQNFLSKVLRAKVTSELENGGIKTWKIVVKIGIAGVNEHGFEINKDHFINENNAYEFLKNMCDWFEKRGHEVEKLWADCIYTSIEQSPYVIMLQDLSELNYRMCLKSRSLIDIDHILVTLERLAKVHALSRAFICEGYPKTKSWDEPNMGFLSSYYKTGLIVLSRIIPKYNSKWSYIADCLLEWCDSAVEMVTDAYRNVRNDFTALSLGDCWTNNILFKYDQNKPTSVMFIDFQCSCFTSFAWDLNYLLHITLSPKIRMKNMDTFLNLYQSVFARTLSEVGADPSLAPSRQQIDTIMDNLLLPSFLMSAIGTPEVNAATDEDYSNHQENQDTGHFKEDWFFKDLEENGYKENIEYFESKGLFKKNQN